MKKSLGEEGEGGGEPVLGGVLDAVFVELDESQGVFAHDLVLGGPTRLPVLLHQVYEGLVPPAQFLYQEMLIPRRFLALQMQHLLHTPLLLLLFLSILQLLLLFFQVPFFPVNPPFLTSFHFLSFPNTPLNFLNPLACLPMLIVLKRVDWLFLWSPLRFGFAKALCCIFVLACNLFTLGRLPNLLLVGLPGFGLLLAELWLWRGVVLPEHTLGRVEDVRAFWIGEGVLWIWEVDLGWVTLLRERSASNSLMSSRR